MAETVNPLELLLQAADGEEIEAVVVASMNVRLREMTGIPDLVEVPEGVLGAVLTLEDAKPYLNYEADRFSVNEHDPVMAWTASWVVTVGFDDGPLRATRVPRSPREEPFGW